MRSLTTTVSYDITWSRRATLRVLEGAGGDFDVAEWVEFGTLVTQSGTCLRT